MWRVPGFTWVNSLNTSNNKEVRYVVQNHIAKEMSELGFEFRQTHSNPCSEPLYCHAGYFPLKVNVYIPSFPQVTNIFLMMELKPRD